MGDHTTPVELIADPLALLRTRTSSKWATYPSDVLPMFVAEMDFPVAPEIAARLVDMIARSDLGYDGGASGVGEAFAGYAHDSWGWDLEPRDVATTTNVVVALTELVRAAIEPGDGVVINSPVYPPFFTLIREAGGKVVDVPLQETSPTRWELDLDGIEAAFRDGARAYVLCHPHNPLGLVHSREQLARVAELAAQYGVLVLSDEIHGPLTHSDADFTPYLAVSEAAREHGIAVTSASKSFNLPALGCAFWVPGGPAARARIARLPESVTHRTGHFGAQAAAVAFARSRDWLAAAVTAIEANRRRLGELIAELLPDAIYHEPRASYLGWIDFRPLGWGDDPSRRILDEARVALTPGRAFGEIGRGFARLNFGCSPEVLEEGIRRIAALR